MEQAGVCHSHGGVGCWDGNTLLHAAAPDTKLQSGAYAHLERAAAH